MRSTNVVPRVHEETPFRKHKNSQGNRALLERQHHHPHKRKGMDTREPSARKHQLQQEKVYIPITLAVVAVVVVVTVVTAVAVATVVSVAAVGR